MSFAKRGLHLDFRVQVPTMRALRRLARELPQHGLNLLMIEWEASFPYDRHAIISNRHAYTRAEVADFIEECGRHGVEVVPLQQCFGHVEYILQHERYAGLRESDTDLCQICPSRADESVAVFQEILAEVADLHPSPYLHIGGDETYLLGHCEACRAKARQTSKSKLYVDYFKRIAGVAIKLGKRPMLWADMLLKYPEAAREMPKECIFIDWNYGWKTDRFGDLSKVAHYGFEFWGASALRSSPDNHSLTSWARHFNNLRDYIPFARRSRFQGILNTSWSTSGGYGYEWDSLGDPSLIAPIRRVYPHNGFRILLAAFAQALRDETPLEAAPFVASYARERFGLSSADGDRLWRALNHDATPMAAGTPIEPALRSITAARRLFQRLRPIRHQTEFAHLKLMIDLRHHHLRFKKIERAVNSSLFRARQAARYSLQLGGLLREARNLDRRYAALQTGFLQREEIAEDMAYRSRKLRLLHARLARTSRA